MVLKFWNKYRKMFNFLDKLKRYKYEYQTRSTVFRFAIPAIKAIGLWPSGELYFVTIPVTIGATTGQWIGPRIFGLRYTWILRHHPIITPDDFLTGRNFIITRSVYRKTVSRSHILDSDIFGIYNVREIFLDYVLETSHYWTLAGYTGHYQISTG